MSFLHPLITKSSSFATSAAKSLRKDGLGKRFEREWLERAEERPDLAIPTALTLPVSQSPNFWEPGTDLVATCRDKCKKRNSRDFLESRPRVSSESGMLIPRAKVDERATTRGFAIGMEQQKIRHCQCLQVTNSNQELMIITVTKEHEGVLSHLIAAPFFR